MQQISESWPHIDELAWSENELRMLEWLLYCSWGSCPTCKRSFSRRLVQSELMNPGLCMGASKSHDLQHRCWQCSHGQARYVCPRASEVPHVFKGLSRAAAFSPFGRHEISVLIELTLGHLRYLLTDVPPQPNSPPDYVFRANLP